MADDDKTESRRTMSVPQAGLHYFGMNEGRSYYAASHGLIPTIKIGRQLYVPVAAMERMLEQAGKDAAG